MDVLPHVLLSQDGIVTLQLVQLLVLRFVGMEDELAKKSVTMGMLETEEDVLLIV